MKKFDYFFWQAAEMNKGSFSAYVELQESPCLCIKNPFEIIRFDPLKLHLNQRTS